MKSASNKSCLVCHDILFTSSVLTARLYTMYLNVVRMWLQGLIIE